MAKMMLKNLGAIVANTLTDSIKMIDIDELHNSEDNFFDINRIEEFAETILGQGGVKDNLVVRPLDDGGYEIISGHRRKAAVQYLLDNGENISRYLPCLVQSYDDNDDKLLDIVLLNVSSRQISDSEMWKSYELVNEILMRKKEAGEKFGRVKNKLAEYLGVSTAQVQKMKNIEHNAIEPVIEAVEHGEISISTANEIAKLDDYEQEKLTESGLSTVKHKDIKAINDEKKDIYIPFSKSDSEIETVSDTNKDKKKDTYIPFLEDDTTESNDEFEESVTNDTFSKNDTLEFNEETEEINTGDNFSEDDMAKPDEETDTDNDFSENDAPEPDEPATEITLADFIHEHYFDLESIFTAYIGLTDNSDEAELLEEFQKLLYQTKEAERNKARLRP